MIRHWAVGAVAWVACAALGIAVVLVNLRQGCATHDAPYAEFSCESDGDRHVLLARLRANPGDVEALKHYGTLISEKRDPSALALLSRLLPQDPDVLGMRAAEAIARERWDEAAAPLVQLASDHRSDPAILMIARIVGAGHGKVFLPYLVPGASWPVRVIQSLPGSGIPAAPHAPLVMHALQRQAIDRNAAANFIGQLKASSAWADAFAIWSALHAQGALPLLYNAGFDRPFVSNGFDWEADALPAGRSGAAVGLTPRGHDGTALLVRLNGKRFKDPIIRQHVFLAGSTYLLRGDYRVTKLRMERGFAWVGRCAATQALAGQSQPIIEGGREWRSFEFTLTPPPGCGPVISLQLEAVDPVEAETGGVGQLEFDAFQVEPLARSATASAR